MTDVKISDTVNSALQNSMEELDDIKNNIQENSYLMISNNLKTIYEYHNQENKNPQIAYNIQNILNQQNQMIIYRYIEYVLSIILKTRYPEILITIFLSIVIFGTFLILFILWFIGLILPITKEKIYILLKKITIFELIILDTMNKRYNNRYLTQFISTELSNVLSY